MCPDTLQDSTKYHWLFKYKLHHLPFWLLYHYLFWALAMDSFSHAAYSIFSPFVVKYIFYVVFQAAGVYFNLYFLIPRFHANRASRYIATTQPDCTSNPRASSAPAVLPM